MISAQHMSVLMLSSCVYLLKPKGTMASTEVLYNYGISSYPKGVGVEWLLSYPKVFFPILNLKLIKSFCWFPGALQCTEGP